MALDRQSIEKHDFPVGRRGYDQRAVDAHLSSLANELDSERSSLAAEVEELKRAHAEEDTLASTASEQVHSIVAAAESGAAEIKRAAQGDARRARDRADAESQATRERAAQQARELVDKVSEATAGMLERIGSMESELGSVIGSARSGGERLAAELERLHDNLGDAAGLHASGGRSTSGHSTAPTDGLAAQDEPGLAPDAGRSQSAPEVPPPAVKAAAPGGDRTSSNVSADEADGARLIALNMALSGTPRREAARYLSENFSLPDADRLLDDVYTGVDS